MIIQIIEVDKRNNLKKINIYTNIISISNNITSLNSLKNKKILNQDGTNGKSLTLIKIIEMMMVIINIFILKKLKMNNKKKY